MTITITSRKGFLITGVFVLLVGIALIAGGIIYRNVTNAKLESWTHVNAVVIGYTSRWEEDNDGDEELKYYATVEYKVGGVPFKATDHAGSRIRPTNGTNREIAYNPNNPSEYIFVEGEGTTDFVMIFLCVCGGAFVFGAILVFITYGKKR